MASTVIKSVRAKTLPEIRRDESVDIFHNWLRAIPCEGHAFEFANELLCKQYRDVIARVMRLKNLEQDCWTEAEKQSASNYYSRSLEAERRFFKLVRDTVQILSGDRELATEIVCDTEILLSELINELRLMGE